MASSNYHNPWNEQSSSSNTVHSQFPPSSVSYQRNGPTRSSPLNYANVSLGPPYNVGNALDEATLNATRAEGSAYEATSYSLSASSLSGIGQPSFQSTDFTANIPMNSSNSSNGSLLRHMDPPPLPRKSIPRSSVIAQADWEKHEAEIKRLWLDEHKSLSDTMKIMSQVYHFNASVEQYKKQLKKWAWSKYLPAKAGNWMLNKAAKRKQQDEKETLFEYRGQKYTVDSVRQRLQRKKNHPNEANEINDATDAPTPQGLIYSTPRHDLPSPTDTSHSSASKPRLKWTPPISNPRNHHLGLMWNGHSNADLDAMYQEALAAERLGRYDEAEKKFRDSLAGFEYLLSCINPKTKTVAYQLASFYAKNDRVKDADAVLDWVTDRHIEVHGFQHRKTLDHLLKVVDMFLDWSRAADAVKYLDQIFQAVENRTLPRSRPNSNPQSPIMIPDDAAPSNGMHSTLSASQQPYQDFSSASAGSNEPAMIESQFSTIAAESGGPETVESRLLRLIQHCEQHPDELATHGLRCRTALLHCYDRKGDEESEEKKSKALDQTQRAFWKTFHSDQQKTKAFFEASIDLTKCFLEAGRAQTADDMFIELQYEMTEANGLDEKFVIALLERIGLFYQSHGMRTEASSWFEQALTTSYSIYGEQSEHVKHLEAALENGYYDIPVL